jgi:catechol 2,3-dioxygenase-like lactoylglutathione lyase family enzyme
VNTRERVSHLQLVALVVRDYQPAIDFFVNVLGFDLVVANGVTFVSPTRTESYGRVAVFLDLEGNRWDLLS